MIAPESQPLVTIFVERLLNTAAEGLLLAALVWVVLRVFRRQNSGTRFAIWFSALLAVVTLPLFTGSTLVTSHFPALPSAVASGKIVVPSSWVSWFFAAWAVGFGFLLLRLSVGLWRVRAFRIACSELNQATLDPSVITVLEDSHRRVKLLVSQSAIVPAAVGFFRPAIVFPAWLLPQLSTEEMKLVVLHEVAHLRRWDDWTNLVQKVVQAAFFFHPAVWWIEHHLSLEREMACDEMVLTQAASPRAYASSLISFAEKLQGGRALALAQGLLGRMLQMSPRLAQILDEKRPHNARLSQPVLWWTAAALALVLGAAPYAPRILAFETPSSTVPRHQTASRTFNPAAQQAAITSSVAERTEEHLPSAARPHLIPAAAAQSRPKATPLRVNTRLHPQATTLQAKAAEQDPAIQETIVIVREARFDATGSGHWTFCIWEVRGNRLTGQRWDSAIFVGSI